MRYLPEGRMKHKVGNKPENREMTAETASIGCATKTYLQNSTIKKSFHVLCFAPVLAQPKALFSNLSEKITVKIQGFKTH